MIEDLDRIHLMNTHELKILIGIYERKIRQLAMAKNTIDEHHQRRVDELRMIKKELVTRNRGDNFR